MITLGGLRLLYISFFFFFTASAVMSDRATAQRYNLGHAVCGGEYGTLRLFFPPSVHSFSDVQAKLLEIPWIKKPFITLYTANDKAKTATIYDSIKSSFGYTNKGDEVVVPIGSEQAVALALVKAGIISHATHAVGTCGGADVSYMFIQKSAGNGDLAKSSTFSRFIEARLRAYIDSGENAGTIEDGPVVISPIEPHYALQRFTLAVLSETSRGPQAKGSWDKFDAIFALFAVRETDFVIVVHTEGLRVAPRTSARLTPPSGEYFRPLPSGGSSTDYQAEFVAASSIARFFSGSSHNCKVEAEGFDASENGPFKCNAKVEF